MIDLVAYEKEIRGHKTRGIPLRPPPNIMSMQKLSDKQEQAERDNHRLAELIYESVKNDHRS